MDFSKQNNQYLILSIYHNFKFNVPSVILILGRRLNDGDVIRLKSWKGDYLHRPDTHRGVTTWHTGIGNSWTVVGSGGTIQLKSRKGDFLRREDVNNGVTTSNTGVGTSWTVIWSNDKISLKSSRGDFLHRTDSSQGVTTWPDGKGNFWSVETVPRGNV